MELLAGLSAQIAYILPYLPGFLWSALIAFQIAMAAIVVSWACGLVVAMARQSQHQPLRWSAQFYIWFIRGTPTLIQIFIVYFALFEDIRG